jgi:predicted transcriptional regulator
MEDQNITPRPSDAELEILSILWEHQPASVRFVHEELSRKKQVGYTTTLKQMQRMVEKKMIRRTGDDDKTHLYESLLEEESTRNSLFDRLIDVTFKGSAMDLVMNVLGRSKASPEEIDAVKKWLDEMEGKKS